MTKRLELIQITPDYVKDIYELFSDPRVTKLYNLIPFQKEKEAADIIRKLHSRYEQHLGIRWGIRFKDSAEVIGSAGFNNYTEKHRANIGYDLKPKYWNAGIMTEAIRKVSEYGFRSLKINRIEAEVMRGNISSEKVLYKCGFKKEGLLRSWMYWNMQYWDMNMFSILKSDFISVSDI